MNYSDYSISIHDLKQCKTVSGGHVTSKSNNVPKKLLEIFEDIVSRLEEEKLRKEAIQKGFKLIENPNVENDVVADYYMIDIPGGSPKLKERLFEKAYPFVVCLKLAA